MERFIMAWEPAEKVQKNDAGEFRALISGEWVPVKLAQKSESGEYRVDRGEAIKAPTVEQGILKNIGMGALKGASDIGTTFLSPLDATGLTGRTSAERRAALGQFFNENANPESYAFRGGELASDIAGTAGIGGVLAKGATVAGAAPKIISALESGGFRLGAPGGNILANAGTRIGAGAVTGGAQAGLVNPEYAGTGVIVGGALPVVGAVAGEVGKAVKAGVYDPIVNQRQLIAKALLRSVGPDNAQTVAANLSRQAATPGVRLSAAEASGDAALAAVEDSLKAINAGGSLNRQAVVNRTQLADALRGIAGDDAALAALKAARKNVADPLYAQARLEGISPEIAKANAPLIENVMQRMPKGVVERAQELARIKGEVMGPEGSVSGLHWIKKGVDDLLDATGQSGVGKETKAALTQFKGDLLNTIGELSPKYREGLNAFAEASKPINQMQIGKVLAEKLIPATSGDVPSSLNAAMLAKALQNPDQVAKSATKFNSAKFSNIMTPEQQALIRGVESDASRIAEMNKLGAGFGSPTARRLGTSEFIGQNFAEQAPLISRSLEALGNVPGINYATRGLSGLGNMIGKGINAKMVGQLEEMLAADPVGTRQALIQALQQSQRQANAMNPMLQDILRGLPVAAISRANP